MVGESELVGRTSHTRFTLSSLVITRLISITLNVNLNTHCCALHSHTTCSQGHFYLRQQVWGGSGRHFTIKAVRGRKMGLCAEQVRELKGFLHI